MSKIQDMSTYDIVHYLMEFREPDLENVVAQTGKKGLLFTLYYRKK